MARDPLDVIADICREQPPDALEKIARALGFPSTDAVPLTDEELAEKLRADGTLTWGQCRNMVEALRAQGVVAHGVEGRKP